MFYGEHEHTIDDKKRLILPSKFRAPLAGGVVLARGIEPNVDVFPLDGWRENVAASPTSTRSRPRPAR